jgi:uncharacterized protein (DUF1800 family)
LLTYQMLMTHETDIAIDEDVEASRAVKKDNNPTKLVSLTAISAAVLAACGDTSHESGGRLVGADANSKIAKNSAPNLAGTVENKLGSPASADQGYRPAGATMVQGNATAAGFNTYPNATTNNEAARFLLQIQLSASDAEISAVRATTFAAYLLQEFAKPIGQTGSNWIEARGYGVSDTNYYFFAIYPAEFMLWNQLFTCQDGMRKRMALGLSEFFVSSMQSAEFTWRSQAYGQYWDLLVRNAFGNFRQLLEDVTLSPAMGYYLNTKGNQKENPATGRLPDENYGREVMQLFTIGLYKLNIDGTVQVSGDGKKLESYTQDDVTNIARVFTGYDFDLSDGVQVPVAGESYFIESSIYTTKPMSFDATKHSTLAATFLGTTIPAGTPGAQALKIALDTLFNHPNVGPFFGKQMIQRFVTSNPSPLYVARVAAAFNNNGAGVRGDLKAVWTAIFLDDEARRKFTNSAESTPIGPQDPVGKRLPASGLNKNLANLTFGKLREPMLRFIQWGRSFGLTSAQNSWKLFDLNDGSYQLGQSPLQSPTVFNFFRPGFIPSNTALATNNALAPEFQIVNETTVGGYLNFMQNVIREGLNCPEPSVPQAAYTNYLPDMKASYVNELAIVSDATALVKRINLILAAGQISPANETLMINALSARPITATSTMNDKLDRVCAAVFMVMACSEYLIQK